MIYENESPAQRQRRADNTIFGEQLAHITFTKASLDILMLIFLILIFKIGIDSKEW